ncbi:hypothetical protein E4J90_07980 [Pseudomonas kribbensis]|uniref:Uncharacterized protein n=2 Tax=Pseudomonas TaxID=286 RepID=A0A4Y8VM59_9PSED|nr:hypothetical protein E4J90_07980 [Pseudomonas kribbensis]
MMLKDPYLNERFEPRFTWFIGVFDVYDREETRGLELAVYNPNIPEDREILIRKYCLNLPYLSYRHKLVLVEALKVALDDSSYDFSSLFYIDECETSSWPRGEWYALDSSRCFFKEVYRLAGDIWREDLELAASEDRSTW